MGPQELNQKFLIKLTALGFFACAVWASDAWSATSIRAFRKSVPSRAKSSPTVARNSNSTSLKAAAPAPAAKPFTGSINISPARTLVDHKDGTTNESLDTTFENAYQINETYKIKSKIIYSQDLKNSTRNDFADADLTLSHSAIPLGSTITMSPLVLGTLPLSKNSRINNKFYGALGGALKWGLASGTLPEGLSITLTTSLSRLFYEADTAVNGTVLNQYSAYQKLVTNYSISKYSFTFVFNHINSMTFQNNLKEAFVMAEEFEYSASDRISLLLGHANAGSALKANGQDSNIQFFNENSSVVYAGVTWKY